MNTKSRVVGVLIVVVAVSLLLAACAPAAPAVTPTEEAAAAPAEEAKEGWPMAQDVTIGYTIQLGHPYSTAVVDLMTKEAALFGFKLEVFDMKGDIPTQIAQVEDMIAKKFDVIIMAPYDATALVGPAKKAYEAGIPVIDSQMPLIPEGMQYVRTYIGSSGIAEGISAGELICEALGEEGGNWVMIEGAPGHPLVPQRGGEAERVVAEQCPNAKLIAKDTGHWDRAKTRTTMENFLTAYPGQIDLVYAHDGNMLFGAIEAIKEAGLMDKIKTIGINGNAEEYEAIRKGEMYGTVLNDASFIAINDIQRARDIIEARPILREYISPADKITKENVDMYTPWW